MNTYPHSNWQLRPFISQTLFTGFLILVLTGLVLFISPSNRIVRTVNWEFLWLTKSQWQSLHNWLSVLFILASLIHTVLNWRALKNYCYDQYQMTRTHWRELLAALLLILICCWMAVSYWGPAGWLQETRDSFRHQTPVTGSDTTDTVISDSTDHRYGHQEKAAGEPRQIVPSPRPDQTVSQGSGTGGGWGEMTLRQFCKSESINLESAIEELNRRGIKARESDTLRELADQVGIRPGQLAKDLMGEPYGGGKNRRRHDF